MVEMRNDREVYNELNKVMTEVIEYMAEYVLGLIETNIYQIVYGSGNIPKVYERTWEFLDSWMKKVENDNRLNEVVATIFSDPSKMHFDPDNWVHGSYYGGSGGNDRRSDMSRLIQEGLAGTGEAIFGTKHPGAKPRPFFDATIRTLNQNGFLLKMFKTEMEKRGFVLQGNRINLDLSINEF